MKSYDYRGYIINVMPEHDLITVENVFGERLGEFDSVIDARLYIDPVADMNDRILARFAKAVQNNVIPFRRH